MNRHETRPVSSGAGNEEVDETGTSITPPADRRPCRLCGRRTRPIVTLGSSAWWDCCWPCARREMSAVKS